MCLCAWKVSFVGDIYELKLSVVMLYVVGMYQSVLYTLGKEFELRFGVKRALSTKRSAAGIFSETGQALKQNW